MNSHNRSIKEFPAINGIVNDFRYLQQNKFKKTQNIDVMYNQAQSSCILLRRCASLQLKNANSVYDADLML